jgi:Zn finger protein HypA/HybF involved in hydrogenase expression
MEIKEIKATCPHCNHIWMTKSIRLWITCPNCQRKFKVNQGGKTNETKTETSNNQKSV